jgi:hypothetical protein
MKVHLRAFASLREYLPKEQHRNQERPNLSCLTRPL